MATASALAHVYRALESDREKAALAVALNAAASHAGLAHSATLAPTETAALRRILSRQFDFPVPATLVPPLGAPNPSGPEASALATLANGTCEDARDELQLSKLVDDVDSGLGAVAAAVAVT